MEHGCSTACLTHGHRLVFRWILDLLLAGEFDVHSSFDHLPSSRLREQHGGTTKNYILADLEVL